MNPEHTIPTPMRVRAARSLLLADDGEGLIVVVPKGMTGTVRPTDWESASVRDVANGGSPTTASDLDFFPLRVAWDGAFVATARPDVDSDRSTAVLAGNVEADTPIDGLEWLAPPLPLFGYGIGPARWSSVTPSVTSAPKQREADHDRAAKVVESQPAPTAGEPTDGPAAD